MIEGKKIVLRQVEKEDLELLRDWRNSKNIRPYVREYSPLNMLNQNVWFESLLKKPPKQIMFSIIEKRSKKLVGCAGLVNIDWKNRNAEVSIYLGNSNWQGKGIASETLQLIMDYSFKTLGLNKVSAEIYEYNPTSVKLFKKAAFKLDGKLREHHYWDGKFWDSLMFSILRSEYDTFIQTHNK